MSGYRTKRIALPGGRIIEIVYFSEPEPPGPASPPAGAAAPPALPGHAPAPGLDRCPECGDGLVQPVAWEERPGGRWRVERRCPACEWRGAGEFPPAEVEAFDDVLNEGTEELLRELRDLARENMEGDVARMIHALRAGGIEPMDF